jgi:hypothetical protein
VHHRTRRADTHRGAVPLRTATKCFIALLRGLLSSSSSSGGTNEMSVRVFSEK